MPATENPNLGIFAGWIDGENGWGPGMTQNLWRLDAVVHLMVTRRSNVPVVGAAEGDRYLIGMAPSGIWVGRANQIAVWADAAWRYFTPKIGWRLFNQEGNQFWYFNGTTWVDEIHKVERDDLTKDYKVDFGAKMDGVTDDSAAFAAAIVWNQANPRGVVTVGAGRSYIGTPPGAVINATKHTMPAVSGTTAQVINFRGLGKFASVFVSKAEQLAGRAGKQTRGVAKFVGFGLVLFSGIGFDGGIVEADTKFLGTGTYPDSAATLEIRDCVRVGLSDYRLTGFAGPYDDRWDIANAAGTVDATCDAGCQGRRSPMLVTGCQDVFSNDMELAYPVYREGPFFWSNVRTMVDGVNYMGPVNGVNDSISSVIHVYGAAAKFAFVDRVVTKGSWSGSVANLYATDTIACSGWRVRGLIGTVNTGTRPPATGPDQFCRGKGIDCGSEIASGTTRNVYMSDMKLFDMFSYSFKFTRYHLTIGNPDTRYKINNIELVDCHVDNGFQGIDAGIFGSIKVRACSFQKILAYVPTQSGNGICIDLADGDYMDIEANFDGAGTAKYTYPNVLPENGGPSTDNNDRIAHIGLRTQRVKGGRYYLFSKDMPGSHLFFEVSEDAHDNLYGNFDGHIVAIDPTYPTHPTQFARFVIGRNAARRLKGHRLDGSYNGEPLARCESMIVYVAQNVGGLQMIEMGQHKVNSDALSPLGQLNFWNNDASTGNRGIGAQIYADSGVDDLGRGGRFLFRTGRGGNPTEGRLPLNDTLILHESGWINAEKLPTFANAAAALAGGVTPGGLYVTPYGENRWLIDGSEIVPFAPYLARQGDYLAFSDTMTPDGGVTDHGAQLAALLANTNREIRAKTGAVYRTMRPLVLGAGSKLYAEGATIIFDYTDASNNTQMILNAGSRSEGLHLNLKGTNVVDRFVHLHNDAELLDTLIDADTQQTTRPENQDGCLIIGGNDVLILRTTFRKWNTPVRVVGLRAQIFDTIMYDYQKGIRVEGTAERCCISGLTSHTISPDAETEPGNNSVVGGAPYLNISRVRTHGSGEHSIYLAAPLECPGLIIDDFRAERSGQNILKIRNWRNFRISGVSGDDTSYGNAPGENENILQIETCHDGTLSDIRGGTISGTRGGYYGAFFYNCYDIELNGLSFHDTVSSGVRFDGCRNIVGRDISLKRIGGAGIEISGAHTGGGIDVEVKMSDITGVPVLISATADVTRPLRVSGSTNKTGQLWDSPVVNNIDIDLQDQSIRGLRSQTSLWLNLLSMRVYADQIRKMDDLLDYIDANNIILDRLLIFGVGDQARALTDIVNPRRAASAVGTLTYAESKSFTSDGATGYISLDNTPYLLGAYSRDSAHYGVVMMTDGASEAFTVGHASAAGANAIFAMNPRTTAGLFHGKINDGVPLTATVPTALGHSIINRTSATARAAYRDGALIAADNEPSNTTGAIGTVRLLQNAGAPGLYDTRAIGAFHIGPAMSSVRLPGFSRRLRAVVKALSA